MVILERFSRQVFVLLSKRWHAGDSVALSQYLSPDRVFFLEKEDRDEVIKTLVEELINQGVIQEKDQFYQAVIEREKLVSTGIGMGVAIPHAKLDHAERFFIAIGVSTKKGIPWRSLDGSLVQLVFLVGGPSHQQKKYLKILSQITHIMKSKPVREGLLHAKNAAQVIELISSVF